MPMHQDPLLVYIFEYISNPFRKRGIGLPATHQQIVWKITSQKRVPRHALPYKGTIAIWSPNTGQKIYLYFSNYRYLSLHLDVSLITFRYISNCAYNRDISKSNRDIFNSIRDISNSNQILHLHHEINLCVRYI